VKFTQDSVYLTKNYHYYEFGYLGEFLKVQWLLFTRAVDKVVAANFHFFQDSA